MAVSNERKPEYFKYINSDEYKNEKRNIKVSTTITEAQKHELDIRRVIAGHKSNSAFLRQMIVYADLWDDFCNIIEIVSGKEHSEDTPLDLDEGIKELWKLVNAYREAN